MLARERDATAITQTQGWNSVDLRALVNNTYSLILSNNPPLFILNISNSHHPLNPQPQTRADGAPSLVEWQCDLHSADPR